MGKCHCLVTNRETKKTPGVELVGFSRVTDSNCVTIGNPLSDIDMLFLFKLGFFW